MWKFQREHGYLFSFELGKLKGTEVELDIDPNVTPKLVKARPVPFSLKGKVDQDFDQLLKSRIIEPVKYEKLHNLRRKRAQNGPVVL